LPGTAQRDRLQLQSWFWKKDLRNGAVCTLGVIIDHTFYHKVAGGKTNVAVSKVVQHIAQADFIFRMTDMDFDGVPNKIGFRISPYITVYRYANYRMGDTSLGAVEFMDRFSSNNFDDFCLAIAFTCRDFGQYC